MLEYEMRRQTLTVRLESELDHHAAAGMRDQLDRLIRDRRVQHLVLDLKKLRFMDSSGIGFIIGRYKLMARRGGSIAVINADRRMDKIFEMAGLYQLVDREGGSAYAE